MICPKCGGDYFVLETTIVVTEKYKILKNGRVSVHLFASETSN